MPKIQLRNSESGRLEEFEPVDAREILSNPDTIYTVPKETRDEIGMQLGPNPSTASSSQDVAAVNIPQLQGDPEMTTGLPINKYGRNAVVKAQAGQPNAGRVTSTSGVAIDDEAGRRDMESGAMTKAQMQEALTQKGVAYPASANKAELQALIDDHAA